MAILESTDSDVSGSLEEFSLAELFRMIDQGQRSGRLTLFAIPGQTSELKSFYRLWFRQGRIVSVADQLQGQGLFNLIVDRGWLYPSELEQFCNNCPADMPLGLALKTVGVLQSDQLNLLFKSQLQRIWKLFEIQMGRFTFDSKVTFPNLEMTGVSLPAMEVALVGLRYLKNWQDLAHALPDIDSGIESCIIGKPHLHLNSLEWQVWEFADGSTSLELIAAHIQETVTNIQRVAYRLMMAGLVEEVPVLYSAADSALFADRSSLDQRVSEIQTVQDRPQSNPSPQVSESLLHNLVGFLRSKA